MVRQRHLGIKAVENLEKVRGAERETDARYTFLDEFLRVDADHLAARVELRTAAVAGVDGCVRLNPGARPGIGQFYHGADDPLRDAAQHGLALIPLRHAVFHLRDATTVQ